MLAVVPWRPLVCFGRSSVDRSVRIRPDRPSCHRPDDHLAELVPHPPPVDRSKPGALRRAPRFVRCGRQRSSAVSYWERAAGPPVAEVIILLANEHIDVVWRLGDGGRVVIELAAELFERAP